MTPEALDLLSWLAREPLTHPKAIEVWRTNRPHHSVWEDALDEGLIEIVRNGSLSSVVVTARGRAALDEA